MSAELASKYEHRLGRYRLTQPLGRGGAGQVYGALKENATEEPLPCAVKFPLQPYASELGCRVFLHEARLAMRLGSHPNIVQVIDVDEFHTMPFIVMEYVDGIDLDVLIKRMRDKKHQLSLPSIYGIFAGAATGLNHAHFGALRAGEPVSIVHRDIKPANILVTRHGFVKLADFGIGVALDEGTSGSHLRGTTRYMSPEHLDCIVCPEMDVYSLGVVIWELLEGRPFREGLEKAQILHAIMDGTIPPMRNPSCPQQLEKLVRACLNPDRRQRPSAASILLALQRCPGYTREPSFLARELSSLLGTTPSSGTTDPHFAATPELVATMAVLEFSAHTDAVASPALTDASCDNSSKPVQVKLDNEGREPDAPQGPRPRQANEHLPAQAEVSPSAAASIRVEPPAQAEPPTQAEPPAGPAPRSQRLPKEDVDTNATTKKVRHDRGASARKHSLQTLLLITAFASALASVATACIYDGLGNVDHPQNQTSGGPGDDARRP